jgi:hypothetical protein
MQIKESHADMTDDVAARPGLGQIADVFIRYGNFTLGGGSATTAVMHGQLVTKRHWLSNESFTLYGFTAKFCLRFRGEGGRPGSGVPDCLAVPWGRGKEGVLEAIFCARAAAGARARLAARQSLQAS